MAWAKLVNKLTPAVAPQLWRLYQEELRHSLKLDYEERLEKLREEHRTELNNFQEQCRNEVGAKPLSKSPRGSPSFSLSFRCRHRGGA